MNRRKFIQYVGCGCGGFILNSCASVPITDRKQLRIIPEAKLNAQASQIYEKIKEKEKLIKTGNDLKQIKDIGSRMEGPALNNSKSGLNTVQVHLTNYTGTYKMQASLSVQPLDGDYFDVPGQSYTVSASTAVDYHTFIGMYNYVRLVHTPDAGNAGTLDKVIYRS